MNIKKYLKRAISFFGLEPSKIRRLYLFKYIFEESDLVSEYLIRDQKNKSGVFVDVGSAWGKATKRLLQNNWTGYSFEPDKSESKMAELLKLRKYKRFNIDHRAVSDKSGKKLTLYKSSDSEGITSLHEFSNHSPSVFVETVALKDYIKKHEIHNIDFLKIDTEGHEIFVLKGFPFEKIKPLIIVAEFDNRKAKNAGVSTYDQITELLLSKGYKLYISEWYPIVKYGGVHKYKCLIKYPSKLNSKEAWGNIIAIRPDIEAGFNRYVMNKIPAKYREINL